MLSTIVLDETSEREQAASPPFATVEAFAHALMSQSPSEQQSFLAKHLLQFCLADQDELASLLKKQADHYIRTDLDECLQVAELIKFMAELADNPLYYALGLRAEGNVYAIGRGAYQQGIDCYDEAAAIYGRFNQKLDEAWSQMGKIYALANLGRYDEAMAVGEWAGNIFRELEEWLPLADLTVNLAINHGRLSRDIEALTLLDEARELYDSLAEEPEDRLLIIDLNRSVLMRNLGQFKQSIATNQALLDTYIERGNIVNAARARQNLAMTYLVLGRYNEALTLLDMAQEGFSQDGRFRDAMLAELITSDCLLRLCRFAEALDNCRRARQLFKQLGTPYEIGKCLLNESYAFIGLAQYEEALASLAEARAFFEQEGNETALADTDLHIAEVLLYQQQPEAAMDLVHRSLSVFQEHNSPLGQAQAQLLAAQAAMALGQLEQAETCVNEVLTIATTHSLPTLTYQGHYLQGSLAAREGNNARALMAWEAGIVALEQLSGHLMLEYRANFAQDKMRLYEDVVNLYMVQGQAAEALSFAERAKSRALHDLLAYRLNLRIEARSEADQPLVEQVLSLREERDRLYRRWHTGKEPGQRDDIAAQLEAQQSISQRVSDLEQKITAVWHKLLVRNAAYAQDATLWQVRAEPVQPFLTADTALLEFFTVRDQLIAFVVTCDDVQAISLEASMAQIQQWLQLLWLNLRAVPYSSPDRLAALTKNGQGVLQKLHQVLFAPLSAYVDTCSQLIIVPHGPLHYLPYHALFDGEFYLLQQFEISYLPAASLLNYCQSADKVEGGLLALGYSSDGRLPHAAQEVQTIAQAWSGHTLVEEEATLENLYEYAPNYRILHLATHGEFRPDNPLFSGLALADGWLTTLDIFNLRLRTSLITLSACQTGRSVVGGGDELLGLLRAFLATGTGSLVSTFWAVEDTTTAALMTAFYGALAAGMSKGAALRQAQLQYIHQHPYFWSPFFLVGDTGPL